MGGLHNGKKYTVERNGKTYDVTVEKKGKGYDIKVEERVSPEITLFGLIVIALILLFTPALLLKVNIIEVFKIEYYFYSFILPVNLFLLSYSIIRFVILKKLDIFRSIILAVVITIVLHWIMTFAFMIKIDDEALTDTMSEEQLYIVLCNGMEQKGCQFDDEGCFYSKSGEKYYLARNERDFDDPRDSKRIEMEDYARYARSIDTAVNNIIEEVEEIEDN